MTLVLDGSLGVSSVDGSASTPAVQGTDSNTGVFFPAADTVGISTGGTERMRIDSSGNLLVGVNSATANGGVVQVSNGITFPATQSACSDVNTLDDYEEGTFTPTVIGTTAAGTATYSTQIGRYTKIGNRVLFFLNINYSAGNGTGNLRISGLPFTTYSTGGNNTPFSLFLSNIALTASNVCQAYCAVNSTSVVLEQYAVGGGASAAVAYDAAGIIIVGGHYEV